ncbi:DUF368 domain-containing protein [Thalassoroseus pseudoceratinae]|uniref:DUF368 domain-containing protein n=1 Tax=Thalassoroseus pseudoceratinae TaxID=2713176 RepID=UPI0014234C94|nr:DUF368 domain-containing protein [Thalassoroseus pseudoceratinae]
MSDWFNIIHVGFGFLMGGADIIPGVSGGTVALILGIYERLVTAVSRFDTTFLGHLRKREWVSAARYIDLGFLVALGLGILTGVVLLANLMHWLLEHRQEQTFAAFFGMILASAWIVARLVPRWNVSSVGLLLLGTVFAFLLVGVPALQDPPTGPIYIFFCGMIAICAMLLPGISGAFILLILGTYTDITGALRAMRHGTDLSGNGLILAAFGLGAMIGILSFSKLLKYLLKHYEAPTMAILCGFMLGSLRKIWPFKIELTPPGTELKKKVYQNIMPDFDATSTWISLGILVVAGIVIFAIEYFAVAYGHEPEEEIDDLVEST